MQGEKQEFITNKLYKKKSFESRKMYCNKSIKFP